jgi:hypothetical protein
LSVVNKQSEIGRLAEVCDPSGFGDRSARKLGLHDDIQIGSIVDLLFACLSFCPSSRRGAIIGVVY